MKKFLLFALCATFAATAFAEPFSKEKYDSIKNHKQRQAYAYNAQVSQQSNYNHMTFYFRYMQATKKTFLTLDEIKNVAKKFEGKMPLDSYKQGLAVVYAQNGYKKEMLEFIGNNTKRNNTVFYYYFNSMLKKKDQKEIWQFGKVILTNIGGYSDAIMANKILNGMFRYKPETVSKEQQIEFLTKLAQIYPTPGTDFSQWKAFMGFIGFKYKTLTGKELF